MYAVVKDFAVNSYSLDFLSQKYDLPIKDIIKIIRTFAEQTKSLKTSLFLKKKLSKYILKDFMNCLISAPEFAKEYGITQKAFTEFILTSIADTYLIPSDNVANSIYRKLTNNGIKVLVNTIPERIINHVASIYVSDKKLTQVELALCYNVNRKFISKMLKRGIAEDIVSDDIAERIYYKVNKYVYSSKESLASLEQAFEEREVTKLKKSIHQLEAQMESDDDNVNYFALQQTIDKLNARLALSETKA